MAGTKVVSRGLQLVMVLILANLLSPTQFGIAGVAFVVASALNRFSQLGLDAALIQNTSEDVDRYLNTSWMLNIARGAVLALLLIAVSPLAVRLFDMPMLAAILPVMALGPFLKGLQNPGIVYLTKELQYHKRFLYEVSAAVLQFGVAIGYALYEQSVWALIAGFVATSFAKAVTSYALHDYRPSLSFDVPLAKELIGYGKWMTASHVMNFLHDEGDDFFVGYLLAPAALGFYQMSYRIANAPATEITHVVSDVTFPAYSKVQDNLEALRTGLVRSIQVSMLVAAPLAIGIAAVTPTFVRAFLGESWLPMVLPMQILALYGLLHAFGASFGSVWKAMGRPDVLAKIQTLTVVCIAVAIWPATEAYGIVGTALVILGVRVLIATPLDAYITLDMIDMGPARLVRAGVYPSIAAGIMGGVVWLAQDALTFDPIEAFGRTLLGGYVIEFGVLVLIGALTYLAVVAVLETQLNWGLRAEFRKVRQAI
jgi:PST family polysaccharide transporter/lipopolysaccharide exporter